MDRRLFLLSSASAAALAQSPNETIRMGLIGAGGRGRTVTGEFKKDPKLRVHAVCDVYEPNLEAGLSAAGPGAKAYRNYKQLLDDKDVDVVLIATPEHWHHRMVLDAIAAGKDVYVEKPLCHSPEEGKELVEVQRKSDRIVQVGMQRRSYNLYKEARDLRRKGELGTVRMVRTYWLNNQASIRESPFGGPIDWEQWLGPAKARTGAIEKNPAHFFNWRHMSDYAGGIVIDQGAHIYDSIHMIMDAGYPTAVNASACKGHIAGADQPESVVVIAEYPQDFLAVFTINYSAMRYEQRADQLNAYDGDKARMDIGREFLRVYPSASPAAPSIAKEQPGGFTQATTDHVANFLECVRTRKEPAAPIEKGFHAALILQLANLSLEQGKKILWNADRLEVEG
ncbi:MAG: Gfo/Idh/MocA family oxidoreductase [Acidobacteria bacterium]|nr:Gfo/Idh/MocA family oxidoreductase [Acidobacteriota bacterium]